MENVFYLFGAIISFIAWVIAMFRVRKVFTGTNLLFVGKVLMIVSLMTVDLIIALAYMDILDRGGFRLGMGFLTGVQIVAAISVATGKQSASTKK